MARKKRSDSVEAAVEAAQYSVPEPPEGVELTDDEMEVWKQMSKVRNDWLDFDLILLAKVVKLEVKIRAWWEMVDRSGPMIRNKRETLIENPILRSIHTCQQSQLSIITKMRIMEGRGDARTLNQPAEVKRYDNADRGNVINLLAKPS